MNDGTIDKKDDEEEDQENEVEEWAAEGEESNSTDDETITSSEEDKRNILICPSLLYLHVLFPRISLAPNFFQSILIISFLHF